MSHDDPMVLERYRAELESEYAQRFPRSKRHFDRYKGPLLDGLSHAVRGNHPFMPIARRAHGAIVEDLDGHRWIDYWQGHYANILGHNPPVVREALAEALDDGRGLLSGHLHEVEGEITDLICRCTGSETARTTTSGSLGTFYAVLLARGFTGRDLVLKVAGGWHGSQPFGLKGVSWRNGSFDHLESEGLSASTQDEVILTRFNDVEDLRRAFRLHGDRIACFIVEPVLGAGGGIAAHVDYLREARRLTEHHGALLLCDEIVTAFRFRAGDLSVLYGVKPDLFVLGKVLGGGMPVAAVAGRREILSLASSAVGRVKFEGGTYSSHELSLIAARALMTHVLNNETEIYTRLSDLGERMRHRLAETAARAPVTFHVPDLPDGVSTGNSLVFLHVARDDTDCPASPDELADCAHPVIGERLMKTTLLLDNVSVRFGIGALSTAHTEEHIDRTIEAFERALGRLDAAGLC